MVAAPLVDRDIEDGKALVRRLDRDKFPVTSALWYYETENDKWRLIIASPTVTTHGPREAYRRLGSAIKRIKRSSKNGFSLESTRVELVKENDSLVKLLGKAVKTGPGISGIRFAENSVNGILIDDAYIYRLG